MNVLGFAGSLRSDSHNGRLLLAAASELPAGTAFAAFAGLASLPAYDEDLDAGEAHLAVARLRSAISDADAILIATPEYNSSVPGSLKNALDWASRPYPDNALRGKPVAVVGASTGLFGAVWAQAEVRKVLKTIGANVIEDELPVGLAHEAFDGSGGLTDAELRARLAGLIDQLLREVPAPVASAA